MANTPYYSDPSFIDRMQQTGAVQQQFGGPFASTRNAIAQRLQGNRSVGLNNMLNQQKASAGYQQAGFQNQMDWAKWNNQLGMAQKDLVARQQINYQRKMADAAAKAAKKSSRSSMLGGVLGTAGTVVGSIYGGPVGGAVGGQAGSMLGSQLG